MVNERTEQIVEEIVVTATVQSFISDVSNKVFENPITKDTPPESIVPVAMEITEITNDAQVFVAFN